MVKLIKIHTKEQGNPIHDFFNITLPTLSDSSDSSSLPVPSSSTVPTSDTGNDPCATPTTSSSANNENQSSLHHLSTLSMKVAHAEILSALNCVNSHFSASSNVGINALFKKMFDDSEIVSLYSMSESKYRYLATFSKLLLEKVKASPAHCILFDGSLNNELQNQQVDVHVRFWSGWRRKRVQH